MANLTQQEFLTIADLYPEEINIWCTSGSLETPVVVLGLTIPFIDNEDNNVRDTLEQVQTITLPVDQDPEAIVELTVNTRVIRVVGTFSYYFYTVVPKNINSEVSYDNPPAVNEEMQNRDVILLPNTRGGSYYISDYNVILNTVQDSRFSDYISRSTSTTPANIQDSLYSDTGWINGRYEGTSTNNISYASIDPAILGSSIQGTYYPLQTQDIEISNIDISERSYLEYFHTSLQTYPTFSLEEPYLFDVDGNIATLTEQNITVIPNIVNRPLTTYHPGDLLMRISSGSNILSQEVVKVISMNKISTANEYNLKVVRGWNNTPKQVVNNNDQFLKITSTRVFELEKNKPSPVKQGKIRLKDTGYIVYTDLLGYLVSGSTPIIT